jgi:hypothetical protein
LLHRKEDRGYNKKAVSHTKQGYPVYITFHSGITQKDNEAGKGKCGEGLKLVCQREILYGNAPEGNR